MKATYILIGVIILVLGGFGYWAISPLFRNIRVNDALPQSAQETVKPTQGNTPSPITTPTAAEKPPTPVTGTLGHPASGTVRIVSADRKQYVRYENFKTINGPDIYVYLAKDIDAHEFVNLGKVKATEGNINYEIPDGVNPTDYPYILTWCKTFGVLFNSARIGK
ncbi:DM13 domain-containing protein [Candidatus Kaiserbacteria bacterium]|nr:DM13 domain-containing protein [Candidatus Kaiserbacteria bacterium]